MPSVHGRGTVNTQVTNVEFAHVHVRHVAVSRSRCGGSNRGRRRGWRRGRSANGLRPIARYLAVDQANEGTVPKEVLKVVQRVRIWMLSSHRATWHSVSRRPDPKKKSACTDASHGFQTARVFPHQGSAPRGRRRCCPGCSVSTALQPWRTWSGQLQEFHPDVRAADAAAASRVC